MPQLNASKDKYGGIIIHSDALPKNHDDFTTRLAYSIEQWREASINLVWLNIPRGRADLIPIAINAGFEMHHCTTAHLSLTLPLKENSTIPHYAFHTIGAGAVVISDQHELLTVLERVDAICRPHHYKLPGGMLEPGEHIAAAASREVFEETGIKTQFESLLGLRHHHRDQFGTSNLYIICRLKPLNSNIVIDKTEIAKACWIPVNEYLARESIGLLNKHIVAAALKKTGFTSTKLDAYQDDPAGYEIFSA